MSDLEKQNILKKLAKLSVHHCQKILALLYGEGLRRYSTVNDWRDEVIKQAEEDFIDYNGTGIGDIDLKINAPLSSLKHSEQYSERSINLESFIFTQYIKNITGKNSSGDALTINFEVLDDGSIEIEIKNVDITRTGWYNVTLEFNKWYERQSDALENSLIYQNRSATALEGIENKTGTFHFDVDCPAKTPEFTPILNPLTEGSFNIISSLICLIRLLQAITSLSFKPK